MLLPVLAFLAVLAPLVVRGAVGGLNASSPEYIPASLHSTTVSILSRSACEREWKRIESDEKLFAEDGKLFKEYIRSHHQQIPIKFLAACIVPKIFTTEKALSMQLLTWLHEHHDFVGGDDCLLNYIVSDEQYESMLEAIVKSKRGFNRRFMENAILDKTCPSTILFAHFREYSESIPSWRPLELAADDPTKHDEILTRKRDDLVALLPVLFKETGDQWPLIESILRRHLPMSAIVQVLIDLDVGHFPYSHHLTTFLPPLAQKSLLNCALCLFPNRHPASTPHERLHGLLDPRLRDSHKLAVIVEMMRAYDWLPGEAVLEARCVLTSVGAMERLRDAVVVPAVSVDVVVQWMASDVYEKCRYLDDIDDWLL